MGAVVHPVLDLISSRVAAASQPGARTDGARLALAIEGGGMRGVVSAGMLTALEQLGCLDAFDDCYGSSAGAISGAYFVAGQSSDSIALHWECLCSRAFIDPVRATRGKSLLSLEYLLDEVCERRFPLDWQAVLAAPTRLHPLAASANDGTIHDLAWVTTKAELKEALRASARIPVVCGPPVKLNGDHYLDAGLYEPIPYHAALSDGATHVLVLRSHANVGPATSILDRGLFARRLREEYPRLAVAIEGRSDNYRHEVAELDRLEARRDAGPFVHSLRPDGAAPSVGLLEHHPEPLRNGALAGEAACFRALAPLLCFRSPRGAAMPRGGPAAKLGFAGRLRALFGSS